MPIFSSSIPAIWPNSTLFFILRADPARLGCAEVMAVERDCGTEEMK